MQCYNANGNLLWLLEDPSLDDAHFTDYADTAKQVCALTGDGLLLLNPDLQALWILNKDGSDGEFCGNGLMSAAFHLYRTQELTAVSLTMAGQVIDAEMDASGVCLTLSSKVPNPHLVFVNPPAGWELLREGAQLCHSNNTNVEFVYPEADGFRALVYERGVGPTGACGSGALAIFNELRHQGLIDDRAIIKMPGGVLTVTALHSKLRLQGIVSLSDASLP